MRTQPSGEERNDQLRAFLRILDARLPGEAAHAERVAVYATATGHAIGMQGEDLLRLRCAATLHDIGKMSLDPRPLRRGGPLSAQERSSMQTHTTLAEALIDAIEWLRPCLKGIRSHHERWDGQGYPEGLIGEEIPLDARVIAVAEAFDAMMWPLTGRTARPEEEAIQELDREAGQQFDPVVVRAFLTVQPLIQPVRD